jgi:hypothetical protein
MVGNVATQLECFIASPDADTVGVNAAGAGALLTLLLALLS